VLIGVPTAPDGGQAYLLFGLNRTAPLALSAFNNGQGNGFLIAGPPLGPGAQRGEFGLRAALVGDIDLDGRPDLVLTTPTSVSFPEQQGNGYVIFGKQSGTGVAAASVAAGQGGGFVINGTGSVPSVAGVGDQNGDGREDIAVTLFVDGGESAIVRVVFGQSELTPATGGFDIVSTEIGPGILSVAGAGDVNGDGRPDIIIGAQRVRDNNLGYVAYVVFGPATAATISLNAIEDGQGGGFVIPEARFNDFAGAAPVAGVGDLNGDGRSDVIVGAPGAPSNDNPGGGRAYVVFGKESVTPVNLLTLEAGEGGGFSIDGAFVADRCGVAVSGVGDQNGDGIRDLLIGAPGSDAETGSATGVTYVVFGKGDAAPVSLSEIQQGEAGGFALFGAAGSNQAGSTLASGDIDGDGTDDILIGAPGVGDAGGIYVVFGGS
jgi:hypothetical protein